MRNWNRLIVGALGVALAATGCDPYADENKGPPSIAVVFVTDGNPDGPVYVDGTGTGSTWTIANIPSTCFPDPATPSTGAVLADAYAIFVTANKLLSGPSIETSPGSCVPTGSWLTASPTPLGDTWFSCYFPSSPTADLGGSVVIFKAAAYSGSWHAVAALEGAALTPTTYTMSGSVADPQGQALALDVTATVDPNAVGQTPTLTATASATAGQIDLAWGNGACGGTPTYTVQRAGPVAPPVPPASCGSSPFSTIQSGLAAQAFTDTGLTSGQQYCYRVFVTVGTDDGANSAVAFATAP